MATVAETRTALSPAPRRGKGASSAVAFVTLILFLIAGGFVVRAVVPYFLSYDAAHFGPYWPKRFGILGHMTFGTIAILTGPFQLWSGLRRKHMQVHRWIGRVFVIACLISAGFAYYMALTPSFGWAYGLGLAGLATAWVTCTLIGYYAVRRATVELHRRWMIRAYVVTFGFVIYRMLQDLMGWAGVQDIVLINLVAAWTCWSVPLLATIVVEGVADVTKASRRRRPSHA